MSLKSFAAKIFAKSIAAKTLKWSENPHETQQKVFVDLVAKGRTTQFGKDHNFDQVRTYTDFSECVPIRDYEDLKG